MAHYYCPLCGTKYPVSDSRYACDCGSVLELQKSVRFPLEKIKKRAPSLWRYREAIPIDKSSNIVSFDEGMTPLVDFCYRDFSLKLKLDYMFPTGSYKDRGASVLVSKLKEIGVTRVIEDSSGNAGAALAGYAGRAGIKCTIYSPHYTSAGKLVQIASYGAELNKVPGTRADTARAVLRDAKKYFYASHNWNPFYIEGTKTAAFEIAEQLNWKSPDAVVSPLGFGTLFLGLYVGFNELYEHRIIKKMPKLLGVQSGVCCPVYKAFTKKMTEIPPYTQTAPTIAEGICAENPMKGRQILNALKETKGSVCTVTESEIKRGLKILGKGGFFVEPTSAVVIPAVDKFNKSGIITPGENVVLVLTGSGLKSVDKIK